MERKAEYKAGAEVAEAMSMLGVGYDHPAVEIEAPRTVIERHNGAFREVEKPAFIKLSTSFKNELADISADALKVWIFIALSVNRKNERANPGLRTIAKGVKLAVNTVQKALIELESRKLLLVYRDVTRYNIYEVPEYASANKFETVSQDDTPDSAKNETVSNLPQTVSNFDETVSHSVILNQINQINQNIYIEPIAEKLKECNFPFNPNSGTIIQGWKDDFPGRDDIIIRAIHEARARGARNLNYVDKILIGWKTNGVPPTREELKAQAQAARSYATNPRNNPQPEQQEPDEEQLALARRVLAQREAALAAAGYNV